MTYRWVQIKDDLWRKKSGLARPQKLAGERRRRERLPHDNS
jgi:hypothetical protein